MSLLLLGYDLAVARIFRGGNMKSEAKDEKYFFFSSLTGPTLRRFTGLSFADPPIPSNNCRPTPTSLM